MELFVPVVRVSVPSTVPAEFFQVVPSWLKEIAAEVPAGLDARLYTTESILFIVSVTPERRLVEMTVALVA